MLKQFGLTSYFDFVVDSAGVGWRKPGREIYMAALEAAGLSVSETSTVLFVGDDFENDCAAPGRLGFATKHLDRSTGTVVPWESFRPAG